jgi:mRNA interferase RelE/StbE
MAYTVSIKPKAEKYLAGIRDRRLYQRLREAIGELASNPRPPGCVKLQGGDELYRVRAGDYRIIYQVQDKVLVVLVVQIGHRREIYRQP